MKFIGLETGFNLTKDKVVAGMSVISVVLLCTLSSVGISALLEADQAAARYRHEQEVSDILDETDPSEDTAGSDPSSSASEDAAASSGTSASDNVSTSESSTESAASSETSESTSEPTTTTTQATTTTTTVGESTYNAIVYATGVVNLRTGPGTEYETVRQLSRGDQIDVVAQTTNGWYKTIRGNYVSAQFTQSEPINTPSPTPKPATATPKPATATPKPTPKPAGDKTLVGTFSVTFYIPVNGNRTASGTTATMGRTVAANKGDFPFGTVIYVENDPLGGDGYYTVEDRGVGTGVIDIFVDTMGDVPPYGVTTRKVYIVSQ
ncbi:MAG: SH3 domain-containing protein [Clostridiales bacterium]|nr:SH3 domain-containing protein [Clostridiales bacterium]